MNKEDYPIWTHTSTGDFTVKSGYYVASTTDGNDTSGQPPLANAPELSQLIWKADTVPKLHHFLWRIGSRALGIKENLRRRGISVDPECPRCCDHDETSDHVFFTCTFAQAVWRLSGIAPGSLFDTSTSLNNKLLYLLEMATHKQIPRHIRILPLWILWRLWKTRNELTFNAKAISAEETYKKACDDVQEWVDSNPNTVQDQLNGHNSNTKHWTPPPQGWVKCNYDASHRQGNMDFGMGWIVRDSSGSFLDCGMGKFEGRMSAVEAEFSALIWAMQACYSLQYRRVIFEGDNLAVSRLLPSSIRRSQATNSETIF